MKKIIFTTLCFLVFSCDPFSHIQKKEIRINKDIIFILSKEWGINTGKHFQVVLSKDKIFDDKDIDLGEMFDVVYSVKNEQIIIHTYKNIKVPQSFKQIVTIKKYQNIDYLKLIDKIKSKEEIEIKLYQPFETNKE